MRRGSKYLVDMVKMSRLTLTFSPAELADYKVLDIPCGKLSEIDPEARAYYDGLVVGYALLNRASSSALSSSEKKKQSVASFGSADVLNRYTLRVLQAKFTRMFTDNGKKGESNADVPKWDLKEILGSHRRFMTDSLRRLLYGSGMNNETMGISTEGQNDSESVGEFADKVGALRADKDAWKYRNYSDINSDAETEPERNRRTDYFKFLKNLFEHVYIEHLQVDSNFSFSAKMLMDTRAYLDGQKLCVAEMEAQTIAMLVWLMTEKRVGFLAAPFTRPKAPGLKNIKVDLIGLYSSLMEPQLVALLSQATALGSS